MCRVWFNRIFKYRIKLKKNICRWYNKLLSFSLRNWNKSFLTLYLYGLLLFWVRNQQTQGLSDGVWNCRAETLVNDGLPLWLRRIYGSTCDDWRHCRRRLLRPKRLMFSCYLPHWFPTSGTLLYLHVFIRPLLPLWS